MVVVNLIGRNNMTDWRWEDMVFTNKKEEIGTTPIVEQEIVKYEPKHNGEKVLVIKTDLLKDDSFQGFITGPIAKKLRDKILLIEKKYSFFSANSLKNRYNFTTKDSCKKFWDLINQ